MNYKTAASFIVVSGLVYFLLAFVMDPRLFFQIVNDGVAQPNKSKLTNCIIPRINPFDPERTQFDWHPQPIKCASWLDIVFIDYDGYLKMNQSAVKLSNKTGVKCVYHLIRRVNDFKISLDKSKKLLTPIHIPTDFVLVNCTNANSTLVYKKILVNIHFRSVRNRRKLLPESKTDLSVLLFGVDSMSRLGAERRLQSTMKYIRSLPNSYIFEGYNKVEESTFVNLIPVLTGQLPFPRFVNISSWKVPLDPIPFIWNEFKSKGASILYAEDWVYSATFALQKGFKNPVFDHYYRPFLLAINAVHKMNIDSSFCYGNTPKFNLQIEYLKRYFVAYKKIRKFALSWMNSIAHNQPNNLELVDKPFSEFFMWLNNNGYLDNTVLIFFADHGPRHSKLRKTVVGRIEDRMPLLTIVVPRHLTSEHPHLRQALLENTKRLAVPYDLHEDFEK